MKQGRRLKRDEKEIVSKNGLLWKEWEVIDSGKDYFRIRNKRYGNIKIMWK